MSNKTELVGKLLIKAERATSIHEAQNALARAQAIATEHQIDLAIARANADGKERRETAIHRTIDIGEKGKHANQPMINLIDTIARASDVDIVIRPGNTRVVATGFPSDLDTVESIWMSAAAVMVRLVSELLDDPAAKWRSETVTVHEYDYYGHWLGTIEKRISRQGARRSFYDDFTHGFGVELKAIREAAIKESDEKNFAGTPVAEIGAAPVGTELVLREKLAEVEAARETWFKDENGQNAKLGVFRGESKALRSKSMGAEGRAAGHKAAKDITATPARPAIAS